MPEVRWVQHSLDHDMVCSAWKHAAVRTDASKCSDFGGTQRNVGLINQLTGNTFQTDVRFTGIGQLPTLPDTPHTIGAYIGGVYTAGPRFVSTNTLTVNEALLAAGDIFTQQLILNMVLIAHTNTFPIKPITLKGMQVNGVAILHPLQIRSLKANFSAGQWGDIQRAAMTGGQITGNPINEEGRLAA